ncbi:hypothetical protein FHR81_003476 [Actinoalloteichus hoggarensis]|uniref:Uncharacterized protein n=1 Tax=Actinoalloteichus hoggarensis TaxID=1470176 RepID=A0A221W7H1_9PSEU|nr:hypothetical protein AHOG_21045 [Actinoalloteichus hoggarensis]MBB5922424.1 hypothetical protein [Actinoalloteichus hoggarensis]
MIGAARRIGVDRGGPPPVDGGGGASGRGAEGRSRPRSGPGRTASVRDSAAGGVGGKHSGHGDIGVAASAGRNAAPQTATVTEW